MVRGNYLYKEVLPFAALFTVECTNVGLSTIFKAATLKGLSFKVFMVYSYAISALLLLPLCYFFHRKTPLPPFTLRTLGSTFILGFLGYVSQFLGYKGIEYSNPTLNTAMSNLTPASTFILAILLRMEKLVLRSSSSQAKVIGTLVSIAGATLVVLYKGPGVINVRSDSASASASSSPSNSATYSDWIIGGAMFAVDYVTVSIWYIYQAKVVKEYPAEMIVVFFYNVFSWVLALPVCLITEPISALILKPNVQLISVLYSGIVGSAFGTTVLTWGLHVKGPLYVAMFRPMSIAVAAIMGVIFLGDTLYLGSIIGSIIIAMGFYLVMWGKMQEENDDKTESHNLVSSSANEKVPLLKNYAQPAQENGTDVAA